LDLKYQFHKCSHAVVLLFHLELIKNCFRRLYCVYSDLQNSSLIAANEPNTGF